MNGLTKGKVMFFRGLISFGSVRVGRGCSRAGRGCIVRLVGGRSTGE